MDRKTYVDGNRIKWQDALAKVAPSGCDTYSWSSRLEIVTALRLFTDTDCNHVLLPGGGGMDMIGASLSSPEKECIEIFVGPRTAYIVKPRCLVLEIFPDAPLESFLLLELGELPPSGVYDTRPIESEELVDLGGGEYVDRCHWNQGTYGFDQYGQEQPLPEAARRVVRWSGGQMMILAKGSLWNGVSGTYDGRHSKMTSHYIRAQIEAALPHRVYD